MSGAIRRYLGPVKARLQKFLNKIDFNKLKFETNYDKTLEENLDDIDKLISEVEFYSKHISRTVHSIKEKDNEWKTLINRTSGKDREDESELYEDATTGDNNFIDLITEGEEILILLDQKTEELKAKKKSLKRERNPEHMSTSSVSHDQHDYQFNVHLPTFQLPEFTGDILKWNTFWESFEATIHNRNIPPIQKFNYLFSTLKGPAKDAIRGYAITGNNYETVVKELKERFGKPELILHSLHSELRTLPLCSDETKSLRSFVTDINRICRQLENMNVDTENAQTYQTIETKLPSKILSNVYKKKKALVNWNTTDLRQFLEETVQTQEEVERILSENRASTNSDLKKLFFTKTSNDNKLKTSAIAAITDKTPTCLFCKASHFTKDCTKYKTVKERTKILMNLKRCLKCLKEGHFSKNCESSKRCFFCKGNHSSVLCFKKFETIGTKTQLVNEGTINIDSDAEEEIKEEQNIQYDYETNPEDSNESTDNEDSDLDLETTVSKLTANTKTFMSQQTLLMTTPVKIKKGKETTTAIAFLDNGSQKSFITEKLAEKLKIKPTKERQLFVNTFGDENSTALKTWETVIELIQKDGETISINVSVVPTIAQKIQVVKTPRKEWHTKEHISVNQLSPELLIGSDIFWKLVLPSEQKETPSGFFQLQTKIGTILGGKGKLKKLPTILNHHVSLIHPAISTEEKLNEFWSLEQIGIKDSPIINDDDLALKHFQESIKEKHNRYYVQWPFKKDSTKFTNNFGLSFGRLQSTVKKLRADQRINDYADVINDQLKNGIIEEITPNIEKEARDNKYFIHYLPHQGVYKDEKKTTKLRIVFDASAKTGKEFNSLNETILRGPVLLPDLCGILIRFRLGKTVILCDIEKAFLQIGLQKHHRDVTRFLWLKNIEKPVEKENLRIFRFKRVTFGVIASPFLLAATIKHHLSKYNDKIASEINQNSYVDNILLTANNVEEGITKYHHSKEIFKAASMNLREFISNDKELNQYFDERETIKTEKTSKILGLQWNTEEDTIRFNLSIPEATCNSTKREILHHLAKLYDPLGILAPVIVSLKLFLQKLWKNSLKWDEKINTDLITEWNNLTKDLRQGTFIIPRCVISTTKDHDFFLHTFADASGKAYAAVCYLTNGQQTQLIYSKTRLNPIKDITIPRLELLGVLIACRITKFVSRELPIFIKESYVWTDSTCVCGWQKTNKELPKFVSNRIKEINDSNVIIKYVPTSENPADTASRGSTLTALKQNTLWLNGPSWLTKLRTEWPEQQINDTLNNTVLTTTVTTTNEPESIIANKYNSWTKTINVFLLVLQYLNLIFKQNKKLTKLHKDFNQLSKPNEKNSLDYVIAENLLLQHAQKLYPPSTEEATKLRIYTDENNLQRCKSRLENAELQFQEKRPIFLSKYGNLSKLIILNEHQKALHSGVNLTLANVRKNYWIPQGRSTVRKIISKCLGCLRQKALPYALPKMPSYPKERVTQASPFENIGLDYLGPINVSTEIGIKKYLVALFTCMVTRAIHLEPISDQTTIGFIHCFKRFISRRGIPKLIISDNAPQFILTDRLLQNVANFTDNATIRNFLATHQIQWKYITENAPWMGGFYERINSLIKKAFRNTVGKRLLPVDDFQTIICEIESIINSRPLTYLSDDINSNYVLRPIDFLIPEKSSEIILKIENNKEPEPLPKNATTTRKLQFMWNKKANLLNLFWKVWHEEYLINLRERYQQLHKGPRSQLHYVPRIGEIVIIYEELTPRNLWKLGRITALHKGKDEQIRSATLFLTKTTQIKRPINLIYPLEGAVLTFEQIESTNQSTNSQQTSLSSNVCVTRTHKVDTEKCRSFPTGKGDSIPMMGKISLLLILLIQLANGNYECEKGSEGESLYATECSQFGYSVYQLQTTQQLCYKTLQCEANQHIRIIKNQVICYSACEQPPWTTQFSFYHGIFTNTSSITYPEVAKQLAQAVPTVCSFSTHDDCDQTPHYNMFSVILLYDNTTHIVQELTIKIVQVTNKNDFTCFGNDTHIIGPALFCEHHNCSIQGQRFCHYNVQDQLYYIQGHNEILIRGWGLQNLTYYHHKHNLLQLKYEHVNATCSKGGITIFLDDTTSLSTIEVCTQSYCSYRQQIEKKNEFPLPSSIVIYDYSVTITTWQNGILNQQQTTKCLAQPFCEMIDCSFCKIKFKNIQCITQREWIAFGLLLYLTLLLTYPIFLLISIIILFSRLILKTLTFVLKTPLKLKSINDTKQPKTFKKKSSFKTAYTVLIILLHSSRACHDISTLTIEQDSCERNQTGSITCSVTTSLLMTINPASQTCISVNTHNETIGILKITMKQLTATCNKKTLFFSREHLLLVQSSKRCPMAGSCYGTTCADISPSAKIPELSELVNNAPGYSYCAESCGGWFCGCFSPEGGCLFYRTYAIKTTEKIIEVFDCPSWEVKSALVITGQIGFKTVHEEFDLRPTIPQKQDDLQITMLSAILPPTPLLGYTFISDEQKTIITHDQIDLPQLRCASIKDAQNFNCTFPPDSCQCHGAQTAVSCQCRKDSIQTNFANSEKLLPLNIQEHILIHVNNTIETKIVQTTPLQFELKLKRFKLQTIVDKNSCEVKSVNLKGCYNCYIGAKWTYKCSTNFGSALATINCPSFNTFLQCDDTNPIQEIQISTTKAFIQENCTAKCPGGTTFFPITGELYYVNSDTEQWGISVNRTEVKDGLNLHLTDALHFVQNLPRQLSIFGWTKLFSILIAAILTFTILPYGLQILYLIKKIQRRTINIKPSSHKSFHTNHKSKTY